MMPPLLTLGSRNLREQLFALDSPAGGRNASAPLRRRDFEWCAPAQECYVHNLEAHLKSIDEKLETVFGQSVPGSNSDAAQRQLMKDDISAPDDVSKSTQGYSSTSLILSWHMMDQTG